MARPPADTSRTESESGGLEAVIGSAVFCSVASLMPWLIELLAMSSPGGRAGLRSIPEISAYLREQILEDLERQLVLRCPNRLIPAQLLEALTPLAAQSRVWQTVTKKGHFLNTTRTGNICLHLEPKAQ